MTYHFKFGDHGTRNFQKNPVPSTQRRHWEVFLVHQGHFGFITGKNNFSITYNSGPTVWIAHPKLYHGKVGDGSICEVAYFSWDGMPDLLQRLCTDTSYLKIPISKNISKKFLKFYHDMVHLNGTKDPLDTFKQELLSHRVFLLLLQQIPKHKLPHLEYSEKSRLEDALQWYDRNMSNHVRVADIASSIKISESHFRRLMRKHYQRSTHKIMQEMQFKKSKTLLLMQKFSIEHIAETCGYHSSAAFSRAFKKTTQLSPKDWAIKNKTWRR